MRIRRYSARPSDSTVFFSSARFRSVFLRRVATSEDDSSIRAAAFTLLEEKICLAPNGSSKPQRPNAHT
jgi:hypothetical protein